MDMQAALRARLLADASVAALVGTRVSWVERPQGDALPAVTLTTIAGDRDQHLKGFTGMRSTTVQADCWASGYGQARALAEAVIAATVPAGSFSGVQFGRTFAGEPRDLGDSASGTFIHRQSVDLTVYHYGEE